MEIVGGFGSYTRNIASDLIAKKVDAIMQEKMSRPTAVTTSTFIEPTPVKESTMLTRMKDVGVDAAVKMADQGTKAIFDRVFKTDKVPTTPPLIPDAGPYPGRGIPFAQKPGFKVGTGVAIAAALVVGLLVLRKRRRK